MQSFSGLARGFRIALLVLAIGSAAPLSFAAVNFLAKLAGNDGSLPNAGTTDPSRAVSDSVGHPSVLLYLVPLVLIVLFTIRVLSKSDIAQTMARARDAFDDVSYYSLKDYLQFAWQLAVISFLALGVYSCISRPDAANDRLTAIRNCYLSLEEKVKRDLRDPDSFQYIENRYTNDGGYLGLIVKYRAKNGFGGYTVSYASETCNIPSK